jgi:hypothetical protein
VSRRRFSTRGPKGKRGTVVAFRLGAAAMVVFTVHGPSPSCGVAGKKVVRGRRGVNRVHLSGRFGHHRLAPGTYEIVVVARRGKAHKRVGEISIQVVPPGSHVRRQGSSPVFFCASASGVAQTGIPGAGLFVSPPSKSRGGGAPQLQSDTEQSSPSRSGVLGAPPFHIGGGGTDVVLAVLLYGTLGLGAIVLLLYAVRYFRDPFRRYN